MKLNTDPARQACGASGRRSACPPRRLQLGSYGSQTATWRKGSAFMTVERGLDPREFSLVAFGGAGPMHAVDLALELEIRKSSSRHTPE